MLRRRARRPKLPDLLIAAVAVVLATAVVVNGVSTTHDTKRARLDKKVAARWFKDHPELGHFGPPRVNVRRNADLACAARRAGAGRAKAVDGYCITIADRSTRSTEVLSSYRCFYPRAAELGGPASPRCLGGH